MFCQICGNEINEQAIICPKCGCTVASNPKKSKNTTHSKVTTYSKSDVLNYVTLILICLTLIFSGYFFPIGNWISLIFALLAFGISLYHFTLSLISENIPKSFITNVLFIVATTLILRVVIISI